MTAAAEGAVAYLEAGAGDVPVLFLHGIGGGAEAWRPQLAHFGQGRRALAWWMPGYGEEPLAPERNFDRLADRVAGLLEATAIERVHLVGHSMGGMVAQVFAARHAARLASLCLVGTSPAFGSADGSFQTAFVAKRLKPLDDGMSMADLADGFVASLVGSDPDPTGLATAREVMSRVPAATFRAAIETLVTFDARALLPTIATPTLVVAGSRDTNAPPAMMERMAGRMPDARFVVIEGAGHLPNLERPDAFNQVLSTFIEECDSRMQA